MGRHSTTGPGHAIAAAAPSNHSAVRRRQCAESRAASMSRPAMLPGQRQGPKHSSSLAVIESALRCCSLISSAYSGLAGYAYEGQGAPSSSLRWLLSLKTSGGSPNSWCDRRRLRRNALRRCCVTQGHRKQLPLPVQQMAELRHQKPRSLPSSSSPTFATKSARTGHTDAVAGCPLLEDERKT